MPDAIPQVGQSVLWDGDPHTLVAVGETVAEFANDAGSRSVALVDLEELAPGQWGVRGRTTKRPASQRLGLQITPAGEG